MLRLYTFYPLNPFPKWYARYGKESIADKPDRTVQLHRWSLAHHFAQHPHFRAKKWSLIRDNEKKSWVFDFLTGIPTDDNGHPQKTLSIPKSPLQSFIAYLYISVKTVDECFLIPPLSIRYFSKKNNNNKKTEKRLAIRFTGGYLIGIGISFFIKWGFFSFERNSVNDRFY